MRFRAAMILAMGISIDAGGNVVAAGGTSARYGPEILDSYEG
jgi:hypothetical protein